MVQIGPETTVAQVHSVEAKRGGGRDRKLQDLLAKFETTVYEKL